MISPQPEKPVMYALAIDLGTTTLAASLVDCDSGKRLAMCGSLNPQRRFGADVVSRLAAAVECPATRQEMTTLIRGELRRLADELCTQIRIPWAMVQRVAIAGNTVMQHLLSGVDVTSLAFPPFRPLDTSGTHLQAADLDWDGNAAIYLFPMPGGFVGGDTVAFLYGELQADQSSPLILDPSLFLDMGTNGEIALVAGDTVWATSAAAGPAFEGGNLSCGMAALPGAISSVRIENERLQLKVVGNTQPTGICGSGAIEAVTMLLQCGVIELGGRLRGAEEIDFGLGSRVIDYRGANAFVLYRDAQRLIVLSQEDIRQIQLAKAALRAGIDVLGERSGIRLQALKDVVLTGSFGAVLQSEWLKTIGIFDRSMIQTSRFTPEGALTGVEKALASADDFNSVEDLGHHFRVVPLSGTPFFESIFLQHIDF